MNCIFPKRIVEEKGITNSAALLRIKPVQIGLNESDLAVFEKGSHIILDFGKELSGSLRFLCFRSDGASKIRVRLGESVSEVCHDVGECGATNAHATRDWVFFIPHYSDQLLMNGGFRFARIDLLGDTVLTVKSVVCQSDAYDKPFDGSFCCDDELVNNIFDTVAYTLRLCIHNDMIWDGVKRDRLVWIGDIHPEQMAANALFSDTTFIKNSIKFVKDQTPLPGWINSMPTYSLWWIINLRDYYFRTGDREFIESMKNYLVSLVGQISEYITDDGETTFDYDFIDWPSHPQDETETDKRADEKAGVHALFIWCFTYAKELLETLGEDTSKVISSLVKLSKKSYTVRKFKQISAMRLMAGIGDEKDVKLILENGAEGLSTFMSYYILDSIAERGYGAEALGMMKEYYGKMLELGATTFWEDFDVKWAENAGRIDEIPTSGKKDVHADYGAFCYKGLRHSFCHGWSSGVIPFLMRFVAGVKEVGVGGNELVVSPNLCGLKKVDVVYPTKLGKVKISVENKDGKVLTKVDAPDGIKVNVK